MVYVYTEDSTSGYDFIQNIIQRVIKPKTKYVMHSLRGAPNCNKFLKLISEDVFDSEDARDSDKTFVDEFIYNYAKGDILILYFDMSTLDYASLCTAVTQLHRRGVEAFVQSFYCFEESFFSYVVFRTGRVNFGKMHKMYLDFAKCLVSKGNFDVFKRKYAQVLMQTDLTNATLETTANSVFSMCTYKIPCVHVTKYKYKSLLDCYTANLLDKAFYNNSCNTARLNKTYRCYCNNKHACSFCNISEKHRGNAANLRHFYKNTVLSNTFCCVVNGQIVRTDKTLDDLMG